MTGDLHRKLLQLVEGAPQPGVDASEIARQLGITQAETIELIDELERRGRIRRDGDRLIGVGPPD